MRSLSLLHQAATAGALALLVVSLRGQQPAPPRPPDAAPQARFKSGVELINVTATVSDPNGRFVPGLQQDDFLVYEDDQPVTVTQFSADRVPVSLGIALDTSGSMAGSKIQEAQAALDRLLNDLLDRQDEVFLYRFSNTPVLLQTWTKDRQQLSHALGRIEPNGGTAMYDAISEAIPLTQQGQNRKKALLVISDGNDTASNTTVRQVKAQIRETETLVYAIGIDGTGESTTHQPPPRAPLPTPVPRPFPRPPGPFGGTPPMIPSRPPGGGGSGGYRRGGMSDDRVNVVALRDMTDDSGGRTEIIRDPRDLNPATASIADELSKQYYLGYLASGKKDGRWHSIRVELRNRTYRVRARKGYVAT
ncbi:MAG TPA: VWA domain-containing protein [Vicinamibacterales bacterium]|nr:VWA domain-containing protein [Vicinamibacterales bacterium]